jgi:RsiW-degrading membrane proteinase PrsW (M82 family)
LNIIQLSALAFAPCLAVIIFIYWKDRFGKEPLRLLANSFFLGVISAAPAIWITDFMDKLFMQIEMFYVLEKAVMAFVVVGFSEELSKFILLMLFPYKSKHFDEPYDGITYAVMISMGFATLENLLYMRSYGHEVIYFRAFTSVPAHASFAVLMGYFVGLAKFKNNSLKIKLLGLFLATTLHGFYDFFLFMDEVPLLAIGALASLIIGVRLSFKAIKLHNEFEVSATVEDKEEERDLK